MAPDEEQQHTEAPACPESLGTVLRSAREKRGLNPRQAASAIRLPTAFIVALEEDRLADLPQPAYTRGYIRSYARSLGVDAKPLIDMYAAAGIPEPKLRPSRLVTDVGSNKAPFGLGIAAATLVSISVSIMYWYDRPDRDIDVANGGYPSPAAVELLSIGKEPAGEQSVPASARGPAEDASEPGQTASRGTLVAEERAADNDDRAPARVVAEDAALLETANSANPRSLSGPQPTRAMPTPPAQTAQSAQAGVAKVDASAADNSEPKRSADAAMTDEERAFAGEPQIEATAFESGPAAAQDVLALRYSRDSWTEVQDADGTRLLYGLITADTVRRVKGTAPFNVKLGSSRGVQVTINGEPFDHSAFTRGNDTARFSVREPADR